ncbi:thioredoxin [Moniliophthora roreri MCA 2997]|uniref:Thioredoxin n=1 Tax=Moniliophthora roreri (strain MCA 2997) TaxID=1381753 RepID=V2XWV8_MONRO|nr:thioredoxin [Moniliophthora roreri MCA 2997]
MPVQAIESQDDFQRIINSGQPVVVDYWAEWCPPCKMIAPVFEELSNSEEYKGIGFYKVEADEHEALADAIAEGEGGARSIPTFILFKDGKKLREVVGPNVEAIKTLLRSAIN